MGVHVGQPRKVFNAMSRRAEYMGPAVNTAARITTMSHGGQIVVSQAVYDRIRDSGLAKEKKRLASLGKFDMPDSPQGAAPLTHTPHTAHRTHSRHTHTLHGTT
jgi:class 3 adenylate cyclase